MVWKATLLPFSTSSLNCMEMTNNCNIHSYSGIHLDAYIIRGGRSNSIVVRLSMVIVCKKCTQFLFGILINSYVCTFDCSIED